MKIVSGASAVRIVPLALVVKPALLNAPSSRPRKAGGADLFIDGVGVVVEALGETQRRISQPRWVDDGVVNVGYRASCEAIGVFERSGEVGLGIAEA